MNNPEGPVCDSLPPASPDAQRTEKESQIRTILDCYHYERNHGTEMGAEKWVNRLLSTLAIARELERKEEGEAPAITIWEWESAGNEEYPVFELGVILSPAREHLGTATVRTRRSGVGVLKGEEFHGEASIRVRPGVWLEAGWRGPDPEKLKSDLETQLTALLRRALGEENG